VRGTLGLAGNRAALLAYTTGIERSAPSQGGREEAATCRRVRLWDRQSVHRPNIPIPGFVVGQGAETLTPMGIVLHIRTRVRQNVVKVRAADL